MGVNVQFEWQLSSVSLPPDGQEVETMIDTGNSVAEVRRLTLHRTQWWTPNFESFVEPPTHWRPFLKTNRELFAPHAALGTFIETGTCFGRSVTMALELGFQHVRSVEAKKERYEECVKLFASQPQVRLWHGESVTALPEMLADLTGPALFWLDAHPSGEDSHNTGDQSEILMAELRILAAHRVKSHVILIDDLTKDVEDFARELFADAEIQIHRTDESENSRVLEIRQRLKI